MKNNKWYIDKNGNICHDDIKKTDITLLQFYNFIKNEK